MSRQISPFAALTGAEKQIKWLEYQSIRLPYIQGSMDAPEVPTIQTVAEQPQQRSLQAEEEKAIPPKPERPQPPPEVPRVMPAEYQKTRHSQYDAVIARMKQAELQSRRYQAMSQTPQQM